MERREKKGETEGGRKLKKTQINEHCERCLPVSVPDV